jgi:hypothetical protein
MLVVTRIIYLLEVLQVPPSSLDAGVTTAIIAGPSSSGSRSAEPPSRKARRWSFLQSSQYGRGVVHRFTLFSLLMFLF